jgi:hypothetical protein
MTFRALGFAGIAVAMTAIPAIAHHSFAMFDAEKTKTLEGTVKEFQWTNPHSWILMTVNNDKGQAEQWAIEMGGPAGLARQGWVPKTLTPGMKVKTVIHPLRDGNNGGQFMAITLPDGTLMGNPNAEACGLYLLANYNRLAGSSAVRRDRAVVVVAFLSAAGACVPCGRKHFQ